jgi:hypothetical protein
LVTLSPVGAAPDKDLKDVPIQIANTAFERDIYEVQPGDVSLLIRTKGGPYLFRIDQLVDRRELPADSETRVLFNVTNPGRYTMHVALSTPTDASAQEATATLDVRPVGSR